MPFYHIYVQHPAAHEKGLQPSGFSTESPLACWAAYLALSSSFPGAKLDLYEDDFSVSPPRRRLTENMLMRIALQVKPSNHMDIGTVKLQPPPYPPFCHPAGKCAVLSYCPRDAPCID